MPLFSRRNNTQLGSIPNTIVTLDLFLGVRFFGCEEEIIVNKRTKLDNPFEHEITFDITTKELNFTTTTTVTDAKKVKPGTAITVLGRLTLQGGEEHVDVRGKN